MRKKKNNILMIILAFFAVILISYGITSSLSLFNVVSQDTVKTAFPKYGKIECLSSDRQEFICSREIGSICKSVSDKWLEIPNTAGEWRGQSYYCPKNAVSCNRNIEVKVPKIGSFDDSNGIVYRVYRTDIKSEEQILTFTNGDNVQNDNYIHKYITLDKNLEPGDKIQVGYYDLKFANVGSFEFDKVNWNDPITGSLVALEFTPTLLRIVTADGRVSKTETNLGCDIQTLINQFGSVGEGGIVKATNDVDGKAKNCDLQVCKLNGYINYVERWDLQESILKNLINIEGQDYFCYRTIPATLYTVGTMETTSGNYIFPDNIANKNINCCPGLYGTKTCKLVNNVYQLVESEKDDLDCISTTECPGEGSRIITGDKWEKYQCKKGSCDVVDSGKVECSSNNQCGTGSCIDGICKSVGEGSITEENCPEGFDKDKEASEESKTLICSAQTNWLIPLLIGGVGLLLATILIIWRMRRK